MAYVNCALCPAQSFLYGHHTYSNGDSYTEYRCLEKHKTYTASESEREKDVASER